MPGSIPRRKGAVTVRAGRFARSAPTLRGRDGELKAIGHLLAGAVAGQSGVLLLTGPPGIGKSSLLAQAHGMAGRLGIRVLAGAALESQQVVPLAPLLDAMLHSESPIGGVAVPRGSEDVNDLRYWMLHDLQTALEHAARESPLAILIDDLQWADAGTLAALRTLPAWLSGTPIIWILTLRSRGRRPEVDDTASKLKRDGAQLVNVGPLSDDALARIVTDVLDLEADRGLLSLAANAHGNPFLIVELLRGLQEEQRLVEDRGRAQVIGRGLPRRLADSMRERLERLTPDTQRAITAAATLGPLFTVEQLALMLQLRPSALLPALAEAMHMDFLVDAGPRLAFRHDLVRQAVLDSLPRAVRVALQREAANTLLDSGAVPAEVALQLAESAEPGDALAISTIREAARALAGSDPAAAADLSLRALDLLPPNSAMRTAITCETVGLLHLAMRIDEALELGESLLSSGLPPDEEAEVRLLLSGLLARAPTADRADNNRRALALIGLAPTMRARHLSLLSYHLAADGQLKEAESTASSALAAAAAANDDRSRVIATLALTLVDRTHCAAEAALHRVESIRRIEWASPAEPWLAVVDVTYANALADLGRCEEALSVMVASVARGHSVRSTWLVESGAQAGSAVRLMAGQLADARAEAESKPITAEHIASGDISGAMAMLTLAEVALHIGDSRLMKTSVDRARIGSRSANSAVRWFAAWVMVFAAVMRADWPDAVLWLRDDSLHYSKHPLPLDPAYQPLVARAAIAAGDRGLAHEALAFADAFDRLSPDVPVLRAIAKQTRGLVQGGSGDLVEAATMLRTTQRPLLFAAAAEDAGRSLAAESHIDDATRFLTDALETYFRLDAGADARRVRQVLRDYGVNRPIPLRRRPTSGWNSLTDSELRVARLIAQGATNREAADHLFLSPHTVSTHLRHTFSKLGINSRIELTRIELQHDSS